jgi:hypothetical protein
MQVGERLVEFTGNTPREARPLHVVEPRAPWRESPRWGQLYTSLIVTAIAGFAGEALAPMGGWRRLAEIVTAALIFGVMAHWLRRNRLRIACQGMHPDDELRTQRVIRSRQQPHGPDAQPLASSRHTPR